MVKKFMRCCFYTSLVENWGVNFLRTIPRTWLVYHFFQNNLFVAFRRLRDKRPFFSCFSRYAMCYKHWRVFSHKCINDEFQQYFVINTSVNRVIYENVFVDSNKTTWRSKSPVQVCKVRFTSAKGLVSVFKEMWTEENQKSTASSTNKPASFSDTRFWTTAFELFLFEVKSKFVKLIKGKCDHRYNFILFTSSNT